MRCDEVRVLLCEAPDSAAPVLTSHVAGCARCRADHEALAEVRRTLRLEPVDDVPDVAPAVMAALRSRPRHELRWVPVAAAFLLAFVVGAGLFRVSGPVVAADLPARILEAQSALQALRAQVTVVERSWHPEVPERRFQGTLAYEAPERLLLQLEDRTAYPSEEWVRNDVTVAVEPGRSWTRGIASCPREALPGCAPVAPRVRALDEREPFSESAPAPLDMVLPVQSFRHAAVSEIADGRRIDGRDAVGVVVPASQIAPLIDGLHAAGAWRAIHPTDRVELWLDAGQFVPLRFDVFASTDSERVLWAARRGYDDAGDAPILTWTLTSVETTPAARLSIPAAPDDGVHRAEGFRAGPAGGPSPQWLPTGMQRIATGVTGGGASPLVHVAAWSDGRAWLKVRATRNWPGGRLFGALGDLVREVPLGPAGVGYADETGSRLGLHASGWDLVVTGSLAEEDLIAVAASLGLRGVGVPAEWAEHPTIDLEAVPKGYLVPAAWEGYGHPVVRLQDRTLVIAMAGPGARGLVLTQTEGVSLAPPLSPDVYGVTVRGEEGRYVPARGELEWVEQGRAMSVRSGTLSLGELLAFAEALVLR